MGGWTRLKVVLSVIYWAVAALLVWAVGLHTEGDPTPFRPMAFGAALAIYAAVAAIWWAFAGFSRRA